MNETQQCAAAVSETREALVRVNATIDVSDHLVSKGDKVRIDAEVEPCGNHAGTKVILLRKAGRGGYKKVDQDELNGRCKATFHTKIKRDSRFKVRWPSQDTDHEKGQSRSERVNAV